MNVRCSQSISVLCVRCRQGCEVLLTCSSAVPVPLPGDLFVALAPRNPITVPLIRRGLALESFLRITPVRNHPVQPAGHRSGNMSTVIPGVHSPELSLDLVQTAASVSQVCQCRHRTCLPVRTRSSAICLFHNLARATLVGLTSRTCTCFDFPCQLSVP
jgi:hypothetical protein